MKRVLIILCLMCNFVLTSLAYGLIGHDAPENQLRYSKRTQQGALTAFAQVNKDRCPDLLKKIKGQKNARLWYSERTTKGLYGIRLGTVADCDAEALGKGA